MWLSPKRRGPVAVRDPAGRVWIVVVGGADALAAFQQATAAAIAWEAGEVVAAPRELGAMFDVAGTWCDGVALDPFGPSPRLFTLEDCHKILQVERGPDDAALAM